MRHEKYKDCGMEWIGGIPVHWDLIKYKYFANLYTGNSIPDEEKNIYEEVDEGFSYISTKDVGVDRTIDYDNGMLIPFSNKKFKVAPKNSTIMCIEGGSAGIKKHFLIWMCVLVISCVVLMLKALLIKNMYIIC